MNTNSIPTMKIHQQQTSASRGDPYVKGINAFFLGTPRKDNPEKEPERIELWNLGWDEAEQE